MSISEVLSKDEMASLFSQSCEKPNAYGCTQTKVTTYQLTECEQYEVDDFCILKQCDERFCQYFSAKLSHLLFNKVQVQIVNRKILSNNEFISAHYNPCIINTLSIAPLSGYFIVSYSFDMLIQVVENLFGGNVSTPSLQKRSFAKMEKRISKLICDNLNQCLTSSWYDVYPINFKLLDILTDPNVLTFQDRVDKVICCHYEITQGEFKSQFSIAFPLCYLEPLFSLLMGRANDHTSNSEQQSWAQQLQSNVLNSSLTLTAVIDKISYKLNDLLKLKVGDVIVIDNPLQAEIIADNTRLFKVKCGQQNNNRALMILEKIKE